MIHRYTTWFQAARLAVRIRRNGWKVRVKPIMAADYSAGRRQNGILTVGWTVYACPPHYMFH